jgi:hypothetical protein
MPGRSKIALILKYTHWPLDRCNNVLPMLGINLVVTIHRIQLFAHGRKVVIVHFTLFQLISPCSGEPCGSTDRDGTVLPLLRLDDLGQIQLKDM